MVNEKSAIQDVSDTALWVAHYRALESDRPNPLFRDHLAKRLVGERGRQIASNMHATSAYVEYNVLIRTVIIDRYLQGLVEQGIDCVVNLGAGLDTRPYRLELPPGLKWVEVDYPHVIRLKDEKLAGDGPACRLRRVALDLNDRGARRALLAEIGADSERIVVLTEGVLPYLTPEQVDSLAEDLRAVPHFRYWIADYLSRDVYKYLRRGKRAEKMKNAPFRFYPDDWLGFFRSRGWDPQTLQYLPEEGAKLGRSLPVPWVARLLGRFLSAKTKTRFLRSSGYMFMERQRG